jgi:putative adhesin
MRSHVTSAFVLCAVLGSSACSIDVRGAGVVVHEEKRFTVSGEADLRLRTFNGSIQLKSWDRDEVLVEIEKRGPDSDAAKALVVNASQEGNRVTVEVPNPRGEPDGFHIGQSPSASLIVTAPRKMKLDAHTGDGSVAADDIAGTLAIDTGDGSIRIRRIEGALKAHTGDGSIDISEVTGRLEAQSGDGSISVRGRFDLVDVRSGDGSIHVDAEEGSALKSDWSVTTGDGSISLELPGNIDAELDAHSNDGRVRANGFSGVTTNREDDRGSARGTLGKGGRTLRVRSGDGSIAISRR